MTRASEQLLGIALPGRRTGTMWSVVERIAAPSDVTPNGFSVGYLVRNGERSAFLKATDINFAGTARGETHFDRLRRVTSSHGFERDILDVCRGNNMDRIVTCIDDGEHELTVDGIRDVVFYLVFELARGDARSAIELSDAAYFRWSSHALHNLATAIQQLHRLRINHNDIKPANLLYFDEQLQKLADLGRATADAISGPYDSMKCSGDRRYAAPELLYRQARTPDSRVTFDQRSASDLYLLGSMAFYFLVKRMVTPCILWDLEATSPDLLPTTWTGDFAEALPYWQQAFARCMRLAADEISQWPIQRRLAAEVLNAVQQLCEPDPSRRGHPENALGHQFQYGVERYISLFDRVRITLNRTSRSVA